MVESNRYILGCLLAPSLLPVAVPVEDAVSVRLLFDVVVVLLRRGEGGYQEERAVQVQ